jgi:hypothetical protein
MQVRVITLVTFCLLGSAGCAHKVIFEGSPLLPAADAKVKVGTDRNENTLVELVLKHVAPAKRLWPPKLLYVVWAESEEGKLVQLGQLRVNENREGHFNGTTPFDKLRLVITAEDEPRPEKPRLPYMLATEFFGPKDGLFR